MSKLEKGVMIGTFVVFGGGAAVGVIVTIAYLLSNVIMWGMTG